jgi:hypothetical protein
LSITVLIVVHEIDLALRVVLLHLDVEGLLAGESPVFTIAGAKCSDSGSVLGSGGRVYKRVSE